MNKIILFLFALVFMACDESNLSINSKAPDIFAKTTNNENVKLLRNGIEIVEFWENGCAACLKVMANLNDYAVKNNIKIYAINSIDDLKVIKKHEDEHNYESMIFLKDQQDISWSRYEIFAVPTLFIIKDGILVEKILGDRGFNYIKEKIERNL
ncbi:TlpA family protein disulfide reductase [Campylobacter sp. MG1]|uniref:TlpA family protein disulfide reductase n=1 Tax=Campylobacter sp. MG1 TaxID=2976332 RepID=UPI00226C73D2|nr:thioredoxin-like domain-containing protein [Campylobacter sp. MG1]